MSRSTAPLPWAIKVGIGLGGSLIEDADGEMIVPVSLTGPLLNTQDAVRIVEAANSHSLAVSTPPVGQSGRAKDFGSFEPNGVKPVEEERHPVHGYRGIYAAIDAFVDASSMDSRINPLDVLLALNDIKDYIETIHRERVLKMVQK